MVPDPPQPWIPGPEDPAPTVPVEGWGDFETTLRPRDPEDAVPVLEWALVVYAGVHLGRIFPLNPGMNLIGRSPQVQVPLMDEEVSRTHARVDLAAGQHSTTLTLVDLESTNGTFVNGQQLTGQRVIHPGDRILVGSHVLKLVALDDLERAFHQTLLDQSTRDPLTGLANRGAILAEFQNRFDLSRRHERPLSVVMVDLDHFKRINDSHGHGVGDLTLQVFGDLVRQSLRATDLAGRIGGEEFLLVLPETDAAGAMQTAERLRILIRETGVPLPEGTLQVTASLGVAERTERDRDAGGLMGRADAALYEAKHGGRDQTIEA